MQIVKLPDSPSPLGSQQADHTTGVTDNGETEAPSNGTILHVHRTSGRPTPADVAAQIRARPGRLSPIIHELQQRLGNSFVQEVLAELHREPERPAVSTATTDSDSPASSNPNHTLATLSGTSETTSTTTKPFALSALEQTATVSAHGPALSLKASSPSAPAGQTGRQSVEQKAAFIRTSAANGAQGWSRAVVDVFEQTDPAARIALQRQLDMEKIISDMPDFEATRLGTLGPLTVGQARLNKKRAAYIQQVIEDFGERAEVFVLFALRGVYDDDAYTIFAELANRRYLHKLVAMPEVAGQIKARGLKTDGFSEPATGVMGAAGGVLGGIGDGLKHALKDDRPGQYQWQKEQLPDEYSDALSQMEMAEFEGNLTLKNTILGAIDQVTFGVPHGVVDLGRSTANAIIDIRHGDYQAGGEKLAGAAIVVLTHLGVKAWRVARSLMRRAPPQGAGRTPADTTPGPGLHGPKGPGQFVIPNFEGPITAEEAKLGAILELNPEAQAAMGRLIARVGRGGVERVAECVQSNSRAALFVAEHGEMGVYALLEADGDAVAAATRFPERQLGAGTSSTSPPANQGPARATNPGNHPELIRTLNSKDKIDQKYTKDPRFDSLAADPDHAGNPNPNSFQEAMAGLEAESRGLISGPIERGPKGIEFYDSEGHPWDVKKPPSPPPGARWRFDLRGATTSIQNQVRSMFPNRITGVGESVRVLLDSSYMTPSDHAALWAELKTQLSAAELLLIVELNTVP